MLYFLSDNAKMWTHERSDPTRSVFATDGVFFNLASVLIRLSLPFCVHNNCKLDGYFHSNHVKLIMHRVYSTIYYSVVLVGSHGIAIVLVVIIHSFAFQQISIQLYCSAQLSTFIGRL